MYLLSYLCEPKAFTLFLQLGFPISAVFQVLALDVSCMNDWVYWSWSSTA
uniref:Uncharacterized protein n=1 Tax=Arundo donax TaxID=35708 RepID=A0A0A9TA12_ARUDO